MWHQARQQYINQKLCNPFSTTKNYLVAVFAVLVFTAMPVRAATLTSIAVTPANPTITVGQTQQFTAIGTFDNNTNQILRSATSVATGYTHSCALLTNGTVQCWGFGWGSNSFTPLTISGISTATAIAAGSNHYCAVLSSGAMQCWGDNRNGQLGNGTTSGSAFSTPVAVTGISTATTLAAGYGHTCAVLSSGAVQCWGDNRNGQLGNGTTISSPTPITVTGISTATAIAAKANHTCAVLIDGAVQCWGANWQGQLGNGTTISSPTPITVTGISTAMAITAGDYHTCAVLIGGAVQCWGINSTGQLGNGTATNSTIPVAVVGISTATAVASGGSHSCALQAGGAVQCWGNNNAGQLGNGAGSNSTIPVAVVGISTATAVASGDSHSCALQAGGAVLCWGNNNFGQLGKSTTNYSTTSVAVVDISSATAVVGGSDHTCALLASGVVQCWGSNIYGQLGNGTTANSIPPVTVSGISTAIAVTVSGSHTCALLASGVVQCWGNNYYGQLGDGTTTHSSTPVAVTGISTAIAVAGSNNHTCVLLASGVVQCWGNNYYGQLGNGTTTNSTTPVNVTGISAATAISVRGGHACALLSSGAVQCWGYNYSGQLGDGTTISSPTPITVTGISTATAIAAGVSHTCAVLIDGATQCWGENLDGQLGDGTTISSSTPVTAINISTATAMAAGSYHTCAVLIGGAVQCWGNNYSGQLGNGTTTQSTTPVTVTGISTATVVAAGSYHTCAVLIGGTVQCWGYNYSGQLGNGWAGYSTTPVTATGIYPVTWLSSNTSVATVDTKGLATSVSSGTTIITATFGSISASTTLQVDNPNRPPTTNAGPDQTVIATDQAGATVSLSGAGSTDPDGHTLRYIWSGPFGLIGGINPTVSLPLGAHTLTLAVSDGLLSSTDTVVIAVQSMIDLLPTALTTTVSGSNILVQDSVKNQGLTAAGAFTIRYYLSINTSYDAIDRLLCSRSITNLAAGAANPAIGTITTTCAISATLASGSYYVVAVVDADSVVVETNETNNNRSTITPSLIGPDLLFTTLSAATVGSQVAITDTIKNQGNRSAGSFTVRYYLSSDSLYQSTDTVLCSRSLIGLVAGVSSPTVGRTTTTCTTPSLPINLYYVIARVDDGNAVVESLESNNTRLGTRLPIGPDLLPLSIGVSKSGSTLTLTYALKNQGTQAAGGFIIRYYLSSDSLYQSTDAVLCRRSLSSLGAGVSSPATGVTTTACTIPSGLAVGAYRVLVRLDSGLTVLETNETNNVKATAVTVSVP